jgi:phosphoglycolate phosphatase
MIKGFVFDLDGTLLDTLDDLKDAVNKFLAKHNFPQQSRDEIKGMIGNGAAKLIERALPKQNFSKEEMEIFYKEYAEIYETTQNYTKIYDGIDEVLDYLSEKGIKIAVVTNKPDKAAQFCKEHYLGKWHIDPFFGQKDNIPIKPDPFMLNKVIETWELEKSQIVFVGDSPEDMETAKNAQVLAIGAGWGFRSIEILDAAGAMFSPENANKFLQKIRNFTE